MSGYIRIVLVLEILLNPFSVSRIGIMGECGKFGKDVLTMLLNWIARRSLNRTIVSEEFIRMPEEGDRRNMIRANYPFIAQCFVGSTKDRACEALPSSELYQIFRKIEHGTPSRIFTSAGI